MPEIETRPSIRSAGRVASTNQRVASSSRLEARPERRDEHDDYPVSPSRPTIGRSTTFQGPITIQRELTPSAGYRKAGIPQDPGAARAHLRPSSRVNTGADVFGDPSDDSTFNSGSPDRSYGERSVSPATSHGSAISRTTSHTTLTTTSNGRKVPPPPPSRAKKPAPPPPMKRADTIAAAGRY